ncbi:MAG: hypothetical protein MZV70_20185 [Desulfobacterales bacterium]|nr:hypothetical protein [Desulfobacterales bacterium]
MPFFKTVSPGARLGLHPLRACWSSSARRNAVNLTDGLDGLAIGPVIIAAGDLHDLRLHRRPRQNRRLPADSPTSPAAASSRSFCGAMAGAGLGFLWFNAYPAQVFMGDIGLAVSGRPRSGPSP